MHCKPAWLDPDRNPTLFLGSGSSKIKKDPVGSTKNVSGYSWEPNPAPQSATLELFIQTDELLVGIVTGARNVSSFESCCNKIAAEHSLHGFKLYSDLLKKIVSDGTLLFVKTAFGLRSSIANLGNGSAHCPTATSRLLVESSKASLPR